MKLTKNFNKIEFDSKDGAVMPTHILENIKILAENLQILRDYLGVPISVNSGYRSNRHNSNIKGVVNSYHTKGLAADITAKGLTPKKLARAIRRLRIEGKIKKGGLGLYNGFVHYDIRGYGAKWDKSTLFNFW